MSLQLVTKKKELIKTLPLLFNRIQEQHLVSASDIPSVDSMQEKLQNCDFSKFPPLKDKLILTVNTMLDTDIADLVGIIPQGKTWCTSLSEADIADIFIVSMIINYF